MPAPRRKRLNRAKRMNVAKEWVAARAGSNLIRGYRTWFGVSEVCAITELRMVGVDIPDARLEQARRNEQARAAHRARQREKYAPKPRIRESNDEFAFIAGYTEGGAPYGITWDEWAEGDVW
jgi:hypothetical protein